MKKALTELEKQIEIEKKHKNEKRKKESIEFNLHLALINRKTW